MSPPQEKPHSLIQALHPSYHLQMGHKNLFIVLREAFLYPKTYNVKGNSSAPHYLIKYMSMQQEH